MTIDLRSDTVTQPTPSMREAMMRAPVGDDVFGEDPSINALEARIAKFFGKEAALFMPTATMANQVAIKTLTRPMDEVICDRSSHVYNYEVGGIAFHSGCSIRCTDGERGVFGADDVLQNINPVDVHKTITSLVCLENTCNRGGGRIFPMQTMREIKSCCDTHGLRVHIDGSRIFNALVASGDDPKETGRLSDTITICLSKGLGCAAGALLSGSEQHITEARRIRKAFGGGMRQAGILAAGGLYALDHHVDRLREDHAHAAEIAAVLKTKDFVAEILPPETNILIFRLRDISMDTAFIEKLAAADIKAFAIGGGWIRFVFHLDVHADMVQRCAEILGKMKLQA